MVKNLLLFSFIAASLILIISFISTVNTSEASSSPTLTDKNGTKIQRIADEFGKSSGFEFVGNRDILIAQDDGKVRLVRNFDLKKYAVIDEGLFSSAQGSRISGVASAATNNTTHVFLLFSHDLNKDTDRKSPYVTANRIYRYSWEPTTIELSDKLLVLDLPSVSSTTDNGGKITTGKNGRLYTVIGVLNYEEGKHRMMLEAPNAFENRSSITGYSAVLNTTMDGLPLTEKGFERSYGIGVQNSFGMAFDPQTGYLWGIKAAGSGKLGIINLIRPDLTSGVNDDHKLSQNSSIIWDVNDSYCDYDQKDIISNPSSASALIFMNSSTLGEEYNNDLFVGDRDGNIFQFDLNRNRECVIIKDNPIEHIYATGFGSISDLKIGSDGALYVLAAENNSSLKGGEGGVIYRVSDNTLDLPFLESRTSNADYLWLAVIATIIVVVLIALKLLKKLDLKRPRS